MSPAATLTVDEVFDEVNRAQRLERDLNVALAEDDLRFDQWRILYALSRTPGALMGELSTALAIPAASLTRMIDDLADSGLVFRRPASEDRRKIGVYLSRIGSAQLDRASAIIASRL